MNKHTKEPLSAWSDDTALMGPEAPQGDGHIEHLIRYLLTVHKRFGNTAVTASLQWGASALWKRDEQANRIAELEFDNANLKAVIDRLHLDYKELEQQRDELLAAAENLVRVKGRHHTEQAYKALEAAIAKVKP